MGIRKTLRCRGRCSGPSCPAAPEFEPNSGEPWPATLQSAGGGKNFVLPPEDEVARELAGLARIGGHVIASCEPDFPPAAVVYTRRVTQVWCGFFVVNGLIAVATALWASTAVWTLYNGLLSYVAMGVLMGGDAGHS